MKIVEREIKDTKGCDERRHVSCLTSPVVSRLTSHAPTPWPKVKLGEIADLDLGKMLDQKKNKGTPRHYLANIDVRWGYFNLGNLKEMLFKDSELERYGLRYGDIVMCEGGEPGRCAIWKEQRLGVMYQKALHRIRPHEGIDFRFLYYYFLLLGRKNGFAGLFTGSTIKHMPKDKLALVEIPLPPLPVQRRIADVLSAYDGLIENNRRRIAILEETARLAFQTSIVEGAWESKPVTALIDVNPEVPKPKCGNVRYVPMSALSTTGMTVDLTDSEMRAESTSVRFVNGDVLLARITPCLENGKTAYVNFLEDGEIGCGSSEFIVLRGKRVSSYFTYCLSRLEAFRGIAIKSMVGASGRQRVQLSCFSDISIQFPDKATLKEFDTTVEPMFKQISVLSKQNAALAAARDMLLPRLMKGGVA